MSLASTGPVATEILRRVDAALAPTRVELVNDSDRHVGHAGHDGSGESHFTLVVESRLFAGQSRVARQRLVYAALGDLMDGPVHALSLRTLAPGD